MTVRSQIKRGIKAILPAGIVTFLGDRRRRFQQLQSVRRQEVALRRLQLDSEHSIADYLASAPIKKLQLAAGANRLDGWLNSEGFAPSSFTHSMQIAQGYVHLDVTKPFPISDSLFDFIFHEHLIEHLTYKQGQFMLSECFRVLKPGGIMRIAAPDLEVFVGLYGSNKSAEQRLFLSEYVRFNSSVWSSDLSGVNRDEAVFVLNHNFRAWGHQFIYDYHALEGALSNVGFVDIERLTPGESRNTQLRGLEFRKEIVGIFDALIVEATKPRSAAGD